MYVSPWLFPEISKLIFSLYGYSVLKYCIMGRLMSLFCRCMGYFFIGYFSFLFFFFFEGECVSVLSTHSSLNVIIDLLLSQFVWNLIYNFLYFKIFHFYLYLISFFLSSLQFKKKTFEINPSCYTKNIKSYNLLLEKWTELTGWTELRIRLVTLT